MVVTVADPLADQRARMLATAITEHTDLDSLDDPHGDTARGIDPDDLYDRTREDHS